MDNIQPSSTPAFESDDAAIAYAQSVRRGIVDVVTKNGTQFPVDPEQAQLVLAAVNGISNTALGNKRIASEDKNAQVAAKAAFAIAELTSKLGGSHSFKRAPVTVEGEHTPPSLGPEVPRPVILDGELDSGVKQEDVTSFMQRVQSQS